MTSKIEAAGGDLRKGEFISPEHFNLRGPQRIPVRLGCIPTNEELMIAIDTAALAK